MGDNTAIEWADATWNPTVGCSIVSPGCTHCYAMRFAHRLGQNPTANGRYAGLTQVVNGHPVWNGTVRLNEGVLDQPLRWKRPRRIFVNSMSDLFHPSLPFPTIKRVVDVAIDAPHHTYLILTKRADVMLEFSRWWCMQKTEPRLPANVWLGVSVEDQARADERVPLLLETPAAVRFLSCEPLLELVRLRPEWLWHDVAHATDQGAAQWRRHHLGKLHLVIAGGESGPGFRPMQELWPVALMHQCRAAGVAFFLKQMAGKKPIPADLMVRELPGVSSQAAA